MRTYVLTYECSDSNTKCGVKSTVKIVLITLAVFLRIYFLLVGWHQFPITIRLYKNHEFFHFGLKSKIKKHAGGVAESMGSVVNSKRDRRRENHN